MKKISIQAIETRFNLSILKPYDKLIIKGGLEPEVTTILNQELYIP